MITRDEYVKAYEAFSKLSLNDAHMRQGLPPIISRDDFNSHLDVLMRLILREKGGVSV